MPVETCTKGGKDGYRFGSSGACYTHDGTDAGKKRAKKQAVRQAIAIGGGTAPAGLSERDLADAAMKTCGDCGKARPLARFPEDERTSDGHSATCVACRFDGKQNAERSFAAELETVDLDGVELLSSGGPYFGDGSPEEGDHFDDAYLKELAQNAETLRGEVDVPIKIGHSRGQRLLKNSGLFTDEMPSAGWIENQRFAGGKLLGDLKKVPKKIADLIDVGAFRKRSVELSKVKSQTKDGEEFEVISALALLGAKAPAVRTLNDIVTAWYSDASDEEFDHMEETVRLLLADVENDAGVRTVDMAEGDVIWDGENGSQNWQQELTAALNASVTPGGSADGANFEVTGSPYYVQDIDQINRRAIVCDWRDNTYWVVQFTLDQNGDPAPAPFEQWTLAEQAWVEAANDAVAASSQGYAQHTELSEKMGDTRIVSATAEKPKPPEYSDEAIANFASGFGIEESDEQKRRDAVMAKFAELTKAQTPEPEPPKPEPAPEPAPPTAAETATLSQVEKEQLMADAAAGKKFAEEQQSARIEANLMACARMGKIDPKDFPRWRALSEQDYELAVTSLKALPINKQLLTTFGSDDDGDGAPGADEEVFYRAYAAATGVRVVEREAATK